jgi:hypothetical protein
MITRTYLLIGKYRSLRSLAKIQSYMRNWLTHSLLVSGKTMTSRRVSSASCSVVAPRSSPNLEEAGSEVRSISYSVVIHQQLRVSFCNMCIKLLHVAFTHQAKAPQPSVSLSISQKIQRLVKSYLKVVPSYSLIEEYAASTSSIRWTTALESSSTKLWSNRQSQ